MAKLSAPLLSLSASGTIGDLITYGKWKGINYARQRVIPANPNSAGQQSQRTKLANAVADYKSTTNALNALDKTNLDRAALYSGVTQSGFNFYVKQHIAEAVAGGTPGPLYGTVESAVGSDTFQVDINSKASTANVTLYYGTSPTSMLTSVTRSQTSTPGYAHTFVLTSLNAGTKYYYKVVVNEGNEDITGGTGQVTTSAA